jgi:lariat debranching enzyme
MPQQKQSTAEILRLVQRKVIDYDKAKIDDNSGAGPAPTLHVAVQGCCHGELNKIYDACREHERVTGKKIDLLLCCGDFQSIRDTRDMAAMAVPDKYRVMGDFPAYYRGERKAPMLTIFIGGNHEASNVLAQEYYGGFVAPNIYYLGHSGAVFVGGLRIAGLSGIFKGHDLRRDYPVPPYDHASVRSAYHVRQFEIDKLAALAGTGPVDVFLSHDWPVGITKYGDEAQLIRYKPFFADDIRHNALGNPKTMELMRALQPSRWFSAHLHCRFTAQVHHYDEAAETSNQSVGGDNTRAHAGYEGFGEGNDDDFAHTVVGITQFLALDKCAKGHNFIEFMDLPVREECRVADLCARDATGALIPVVDPMWQRVIAATHERVPWAGANRQYSEQERTVALQALRTALTAVTPTFVPLRATTTAAVVQDLGLKSIWADVTRAVSNEPANTNQSIRMSTAPSVPAVARPQLPLGGEQAGAPQSGAANDESDLDFVEDV